MRVCSVAVIGGSYSPWEERSNSLFEGASIQRGGKRHSAIQRADLQRPSPAIRRTVACTATRRYTQACLAGASRVFRRSALLRAARSTRSSAGNFGFVMVISRWHEIIRRRQRATARQIFEYASLATIPLRSPDPRGFLCNGLASQLFTLAADGCRAQLSILDRFVSFARQPAR